MNRRKELFDSKWVAEPYSGCWLWIGASCHQRYGQFYMGKVVLAHRAAWMLYRGEIPQGLHVCHHCDTGICVNPNHLFLGTATDNLQDCARKGRAGKKLTREQAREIINNCASTHRELAVKYGVAHTTVSRIKSGLIWSHAGGT